VVGISRIQLTTNLQVEHRPVLPKSASWEPEAVRRKPKQVNAMIALPEDLLRGNVEVAK